MKKLAFNFFAIALSVFALISCEKSFNEIGENLIDQTNFEVLEVDQDLLSVETEQVFFHDPSGTGVPFPVQTDNLSYDLLGYYYDPVYGATTNTIVSKVALSSYGQEFDETTEIKEVVLSIPYFSTRVSVESDGSSTYELDSIYGNTPIKLSIHRSGYYLNDYSPGDDGSFDEDQLYFSNDKEIIESNLVSEGVIYESSVTQGHFLPSNDEIVLYESEEEETVENRLSPRLRVVLDNDDFNWLIDPNNINHLENESAFQDFYRGLYFSAEAIDPTAGTLLGLDLSQASIVINYEYQQRDEDGEVVLDDDNNPVILDSNVIMSFVDKSVTFFENDFALTPSSNRLYLKGGEGAMAKIKLFGEEDTNEEGFYPELESLKALAAEEKWLINEANIQLYVDNTLTNGGNTEPERIMLLDVDNNRVLLDYLFDPTTDSNLNNVKIKHLGRLERNDTGKGIRYKISLTEHVNSLLKLDSTNVELGVMVSNNISDLGGGIVKNTEDSEGNSTRQLLGTVQSHKGTVLFNEDESNGDQRLKLKIYYTKED